jgi:uncharacterized protein (TIGR02391 family)
MWVIKSPQKHDVNTIEFSEPLEWKCEQEADADAVEGVKLDFFIQFGWLDPKLPAQRARQKLEATLAKHNITWIEPTIHDWLIDLDQVRNLCPELSGLPWLQGKIPVTPEYETSEYSVGNEWTVHLAFYIYPASATGVSAKVQNLYLLQQMLHPVIAAEAWPAFLRADYDAAVFQAFKEVEVAVRTKGNFDARDIGTDLMRKAFHETSGPLANSSLPIAERQAISSLFAGAIGIYKNPHSHRTILISDPIEAVEKIILASRLMKIVDTLSP